ncbi:hypothetical protein LguiB_014019 [Lonicera macranthoides]
MGMAAELSDDILHNIFLKLSVKSVLRCRSVCRAWRQLLCDLIFVRMHVNLHHQSQEKLLLTTGISLINSFCSIDYFEETQVKAVPRNFPLKVSSCSCFLLGSCNGLLWIGVDKRVDGVDCDMVLWNPSTGDYKILPNPCPSIEANYFEGDQLLGLGYCNGNYKIVRVIRDGEYGRVDIYTLKTNSWKKNIEYVFKEMRSFKSPNIRGTAVNGRIYWSVVYVFHDHRLSQNVLGFDLKNEKFTELPMPFEGSWNKDAYLIVIEGLLGICCIKVTQTRDIIVWKMREIDDGKNEWIKMITMSLCGFNIEPLYCGNGKIFFYKDEFIADLTENFAAYDPKTGTSESYPISGIHWPVDDWVIYSESLVSPNAW